MSLAYRNSSDKPAKRHFPFSNPCAANSASTARSTPPHQEAYMLHQLVVD